MEKKYELNAQDVLQVLEQQLEMAEFNGHTNYTPYQEFDSEGDQVYSNLISGKWAWQEAVSFFHV
jgi:Plavaka transposase